MRRQQAAFTLIELLVVISIIGLLIAIFVPQIPAILSYYRVHVSRSVMHQISMGVDEYNRVYGAYPFDLARMHSSNTYMLNSDTDGSGGWSDSNTVHYGNAQGCTSIFLQLQGPEGAGWGPTTLHPKIREFGPFFESPGFAAYPISGAPYFADPFGRPVLYYRANLSNKYDTVVSSYDDRQYRLCQIRNRDAWLQRGANDLPYGSGYMTSDSDNGPTRTHWLKRVTRSKSGSTCYPENPKSYILWLAGGDERFGYWAWSDEHGGFICDVYPDDNGSKDGVIGGCDDILSSGDR